MGHWPEASQSDELDRFHFRPRAALLGRQWRQTGAAAAHKQPPLWPLLKPSGGRVNPEQQAAPADSLALWRAQTRPCPSLSGPVSTQPGPQHPGRPPLGGAPL